jgi:hypothetical protein
LFPADSHVDAINGFSNGRSQAVWLLWFPCESEFQMRLMLIAMLVGMVWILNDGTAQVLGAAEGVTVPKSVGMLERSSVSVVLAADRKAQLPIVISADASAEIKALAQDLAGFLGRITGGTFEVTTGSGSTGIVVGTIGQFPQAELKQALTITNGFDGKEAYAIRCEPGRLLLLGATELAASHAVYRMLELAGCRWYFPGEAWEIIPSEPNLSFSWNETDRPVILSRSIWYAWGFFKDSGKPLVQARSRVDYQTWSKRNRMAASLSIRCGHAWQTIISSNKAVFEANPEYFALVKGKRQTKIEPAAKFCVSNPKVQELVAQYAVDCFKREPNADMVSVEPSDGGGHCQCEECAKLGGVSELVFTIVNVAARAVAREFPGKMVGTYAYNFHSQPPRFPVEPNVYVQLTAGFTYGEKSFTELLKEWPEKCKNMGYYYFSTWVWDQDRLPGGRVASLAYLRERIPVYAASRATSVDAESGNNWGLHGRNYYLANRMLWNPGVDVDALLSDFYSKAFGAGAGAMKRYFDRLDTSDKPLLSSDLIGAALADLDEASALTKNDPAIQRRIDDLKHFMRWIHLTWMYDREDDKAVRTQLAVEALTLVYRTRYSYMNHYEGMRQRWTRVVSEEAKEPSWHPLDAKSAKPWEVETPVTSEETQKWFREGLEYFKTIPVTEKKYSDDYVPVRNPDSGSVKAEQSVQVYQGAGRYAMYSVGGEALEMDVVVGIYPQYRDKPDARYVVTDAKGQVIAQERLDLDNKPKRLSVAVPNAGLYFLEFNDSGSGWRITLPATSVYSILTPRDRMLSQQVPLAPLYFYVPRGTKTIDFYWNSMRNTTVPVLLNPLGKKVIELKSRSCNYSVPVPAGMDGKVWSLSKTALRHLWFYNLPSMLGTSGDVLLVPREVAEADGLSVYKR